MKYDQQLSDLKNQLTNAKNVLVALSPTLTVDNLAAGLSLALSLEASGKNVAVVSSGDPLVSHSTLFGVGKIQKELSANGTGKFILTIGGVVDENGQPLLQGVDYNTLGSDLNLVFPITPGKSFEPKYITPKFEGTSYDIIFVVGAQSLEQLGEVYQKNQETFQKTQVINIDNNPQNSQFGAVKVVDVQATTLSEMAFQVIGGLGLEVNRDIAQNLLRGMSGNLGQTGQASMTNQSSGFDFTQMYKPNPEPQGDNFTVPSVVDSRPRGEESSEKEPGLEVAQSGNEAEAGVEPEEDWLTPKVFGGKSIG